MGELTALHDAGDSPIVVEHLDSVSGEVVFLTREILVNDGIVRALERTAGLENKSPAHGIEFLQIHSAGAKGHAFDGRIKHTRRDLHMWLLAEVVHQFDRHGVAEREHRAALGADHNVGADTPGALL